MRDLVSFRYFPLAPLQGLLIVFPHPSAYAVGWHSFAASRLALLAHCVFRVIDSIALWR
jgi:hypothetical protein